MDDDSYRDLSKMSRNHSMSQLGIEDKPAFNINDAYNFVGGFGRF